MSRYAAESITTDAGCFGHVDLCQLRTKLKILQCETTAHCRIFSILMTAKDSALISRKTISRKCFTDSFLLMTTADTEKCFRLFRLDTRM